MKNIVLVQVVDNYGPNKFLPLAISYQWLMALKNPDVSNNWQMQEVLIEKINIEKWIKELDYTIDAVAMSSYVWNWEFNKELAKQIKIKYPECRIIVGGPQVPKHDPEFVRNHPYFDVAILGENEKIFQEILLKKSLDDLSACPGIVTKNTTHIVQPSRTDDLSELPSPILTGFYDQLIDSYETKHNKKFQWQVTFETMRGCPYHCAFCDIGDDYWNKTKLFDMDRVQQEIQWMADRKIEYVSVCDSNWGLFERDYQITQWVIESKIKTGYPKFWDVTWAKNNPDRVQRIVMLDRSAGTRLFKGITFAMQSMDPSTLSTISRFNIRDGATYEAMSFYRKNDVPTYSELIWPLPGETLLSYKQGLQKLLDLGQRDFLMVHPLVLTHNAPMGQPEYRKKHLLTTQNLPLDTFWLEIDDIENYILEKVDVVRSTDRISFEEMLEGHLVAHWLVVLYFYGWAHLAIDYVKKTQGVNEIDFVSEWLCYFRDRDNLVGQEHQKTYQSLKNVFDNDAVWGRQVSKTDNIYWEFKSATSVVIHRDREKFSQCLREFLYDVYGIMDAGLIEINMDMCVDWTKQYPYQKTYSVDVLEKLFGITHNLVQIDHWDRECQDDAFFIKKAYHWQRKNRYWKCSIKHAE